MYKSVQDTFLYFAYGSNLLKKKLCISNLSADYLANGQLYEYQLEFNQFTEVWQGTCVTIAPAENSHVWGAIWRLHNAEMSTLDKQEGVEAKRYFPKMVEVILSDGSKVQCRTYQQTNLPTPREKGVELPEDRRPSITYLNCLLCGAIECKLPEDYIQELRQIPNNGQIAPLMIEKLKLH